MIYEGFNNTLSRFKRIKPITLALQITEKCNAKCIMCNIWNKGISSGIELSINDYKKLLKQDFFSNITAVMLTGGEACLRQDIDEIIQILIKSLPRLNKITIATNGLSTQLIKKRLNLICSQITKTKSFKLFVQVSYDGMGKTHDKIRGIPRANQKVRETIEELIKFRQQYVFMNIAVGCVIQAFNIDEIEKVFYFFKEKKIESVFPVVCQDDYYYKNFSDNTFLLDKKQTQKAQEVLNKLILIEPNPGKKKLYSDFIGMLEGKKNSRACPALRDTITIEPNGNIIPCMNSGGKIIGNIKEQSVKKLWFSSNSKEIVNKISFETCPNCMFACGVSYFEVLIYVIFNFLRKKN